MRCGTGISRIMLAIVFLSAGQLAGSPAYPRTGPFQLGEVQENTTDSADEHAASFIFTIRFGQGGFNDSRSPIGKLGGGQMCLDVRHRDHPLALSLTGEYYTNSPEPTHPYEIPDLIALNILYIPIRPARSRLTYFAGGGFGRLGVPVSESDPDNYERAILCNLEAGVNCRLFWKIGVYGLAKYLYARKTVHGTRFIDFNEFIGMIGLTLSFEL